MSESNTIIETFQNNSLYCLEAIKYEYDKAVKKFSRSQSLHESYALLLEEVDELWDEIKKKNRSNKFIKREAVQVAAMALSILVDFKD